MKVLIQRVLSASCIIDEKCHCEISRGLVLFSCFEKDDKLKQVMSAVEKISKLRIFSDDNGKMNLDIKQVDGKILNISQFTLSWNGSGGNRPSFENSMPPSEAKNLYETMNYELQKNHIIVLEGIFGADMKIQLINDGPVTFHLNF